MSTADDIFDEPARWRAEAVADLHLDAERVPAAVSPGAGFPAVLRSMLSAIRESRSAVEDPSSAPTVGERERRLELIVDIGAGVGGVSEWMRRHTGATVVAVEPAATARAAAASLFPDLDVRAGSAASTGLATSCADVVLLTGVVSVIDDIGEVLREVRRIVRPGGALAIADLFAAGRTSLRRGRNAFRSLEEMSALLQDDGWTIVELGVGAINPPGGWGSVGDRVSEWISSHRGDEVGFQEWIEDQEHLQRHIADGDVTAGCLVARRSAATAAHLDVR